MTSTSDRALFRKAIANLRVLCPTDRPVSVRRVQMSPDIKGDASISVRGQRRYNIRINTQYCIDIQIETLVHEWAHCMTWYVTHERQLDHGPHFGIAYAEAYRATYE